MYPFAVYIVKATICLILFAVFFRLILMRETFFSLTRAMLVIGLIACSLLPLVKVTLNTPGAVSQSLIKLEEAIIFQPAHLVAEGGSGELALQNINNPKIASSAVAAATTSEKISPAKANRWIAIFIVIYFTGIALMISRVIISLIRVKKLISGGRIEQSEGYKLVITREEVSAFSFFRYIVLSGKDYLENPNEIILHEKMHIHKRHNLDIIFSELILILHWFNPMVWMLCRDLREIHEYEADNAVINAGIEARNYQLLLVRKAVGDRRFTSVANSFNQSKIKNRITMMLKKQSPSRARLKVLFVLPLAAVMLLAFAEPQIEMQNGSIVQKVQSNPFYYWQQVQDYCKEESITVKDLEYKINAGSREQYLIILINSKNQIMYNNPETIVQIKTPEELSSKLPVQKLKEMIIESIKLNNSNPIFISMQNDDTSSAQFVFNFLNNILPSAYEMAMNELPGQKPLLLLHTIPRSYSEVANTYKQDMAGDENSFLIQIATKDNEKMKSNNFNFTAKSYGEEFELSAVSLRFNIETGESFFSNYAAEKNENAIVSVGTNAKPVDLENVQTILDEKFKTEKTIFVQSLR